MSYNRVYTKTDKKNNKRSTNPSITTIYHNHLKSPEHQNLRESSTTTFNRETSSIITSTSETSSGSLQNGKTERLLHHQKAKTDDISTPGARQEAIPRSTDRSSTEGDDATTKRGLFGSQRRWSAFRESQFQTSSPRGRDRAFAVLSSPHWASPSTVLPSHAASGRSALKDSERWSLSSLTYYLVANRWSQSPAPVAPCDCPSIRRLKPPIAGPANQSAPELARD